VITAQLGEQNAAGKRTRSQGEQEETKELAGVNRRKQN